LDPGETASCGPVDYTVTSADVSAGEVVNTATAYGTPPVTDPSDPPVEVSADDTVNTPISGKPPIPVPAFGCGGLLILLTAFSLVGWRRLRASPGRLTNKRMINKQGPARVALYDIEVH